MADNPPRVTGIGGVFFRSADPDRTKAWYARHFGLAMSDWGGCSFHWRDDADPTRAGETVWAAFPADTDYFGRSQALMINYRVDNLDAVLTALQAEGVTVLPERADEPNGRFAWIIDGDGNRVELWEPKPAGGA
jgi:predicted enzyme related to lactoylglutathione lyase